MTEKKPLSELERYKNVVKNLRERNDELNEIIVKLVEKFILED